MSNFNQEMTRWTSPTNSAFYALHKNAIGLYHTAAVVVQLIWLVFSTRPLASMVIDNIPEVGTYATIISFVVLGFLHYVIHELVRYVFYNWLDNDPNTNSSFGSIASLVVIMGAMLMLDIQGVTSFIRDEKKFSELHTQNETQANGASQKRIEQFHADLSTINTAFNTEFEAIKTQYAAKIAKIQRRKTYDDFDIRKKNADIAAVKIERDNALSIKKTELATAQKSLVDLKNTDLQGLNKKHSTITDKIENADLNNEAKAHSYGWVVSIFCLIALLFCTYQSTILRVKSGQKPVSRFTIADATGSTTTKFFDVLEDAWQRQSHRFLVWFHSVVTTGTQELDEIDGAFILKKKASQSVTPPTPPTPPTGGTSGGGGSKPPVSPAPPAPAQPLGGEDVLKYKKALLDATNDLGKNASEIEITKLADAYYQKMQKHTPSVATNIYARIAGSTSLGQYLISFWLYLYESNGKFICSSHFERLADINGINGNWENTENLLNEPEHLIDSWRHKIDSNIELYKPQIIEAFRDTHFKATLPQLYMFLGGKVGQILFNEFPTPAPSVQTQPKSEITNITAVITDDTVKDDIENKRLIDAFRGGIQDLNSECRNYETKNGSLSTIIDRIAKKLVYLYEFSQTHKDIIPTNIYSNFSKAYDRAKGIIEEYKEVSKL